MSIPRRVKVKGWKPKGYERIGKPKFKREDAEAKYFLDAAAAIFDKSDLLDTAVRDNIATGLAYIVECGYDCQACSLGIEGEAFSAFIEASTAEWFRSRGFAEWFCQGASVLFRTSRPRILNRSKITVKVGKGVRTITFPKEDAS